MKRYNPYIERLELQTPWSILQIMEKSTHMSSENNRDDMIMNGSKLRSIIRRKMVTSLKTCIMMKQKEEEEVHKDAHENKEITQKWRYACALSFS